MNKSLLILALLCPLAAAQITTVVSGNLNTLTGATAPGTVRFSLKGCNGRFVRVSGISLLNIAPIEITAGELAGGFTLYRNSAIECDGSTDSNYYEIEVRDGGTRLYSETFRFTDATADLNSATPINNTADLGSDADTKCASAPSSNERIANLNTVAFIAQSAPGASAGSGLPLDSRQDRSVRMLHPSVDKAGRGTSVFSTNFGPSFTIGQNVKGWRSAFNFEQASTDSGYCDWTVQVLMHNGAKTWKPETGCVNYKGGLYVATEQIAPATQRAEAANFILYYDTLAGGQSANVELDSNNASASHAPTLSPLYSGMSVVSGGPKSPGTGVWIGRSVSSQGASWGSGLVITDFANQGVVISSKAAPVDNTSPAAALLMVPHADSPPFYQIRGTNAAQSNTAFSIDQAGRAAFTDLQLNGKADDFSLKLYNSAKSAKNWQILNEAAGGVGGAGNLCFYDASSKAVRGCVLGTGGLVAYGGVLANGVTPSVGPGQIGLGTTTGVGNGSPETPVTTTSMGTGSGPKAPGTVVNYLKVNIGGTDYWIPLVR